MRWNYRYQVPQLLSTCGHPAHFAPLTMWLYERWLRTRRRSRETWFRCAARSGRWGTRKRQQKKRSVRKFASWTFLLNIHEGGHGIEAGLSSVDLGSAWARSWWVTGLKGRFNCAQMAIQPWLQSCDLAYYECLLVNTWPNLAFDFMAHPDISLRCVIVHCSYKVDDRSVWPTWYIVSDSTLCLLSVILLCVHITYMMSDSPLVEGGWAGTGDHTHVTVVLTCLCMV